MWVRPVEEVLSTNYPRYPHDDHHHGDLVDCLAEVSRQWRRDNGIWCWNELEYLADEFPWSKEVAEWLGVVYPRIHHALSRRAAYALHEWIAQVDQSKMGGKPHEISEIVGRFAVMKNAIRTWLAEHYPESGDKRARVADVGGQHGEMALEWCGLPGTGLVVNYELSLTNCGVAEAWRYNDRLLNVCAFSDLLPVPDDYFDLTVCAGVLEHLAAPEDTFKELRRITRPGGLVVINVPFGGMEGAPNPAADPLSWRSHIQSIDPRTFLKYQQNPQQWWLDYSDDQHMPHSWIGTYGEWIVCFELVK